MEQSAQEIKTHELLLPGCVFWRDEGVFVLPSQLKHPRDFEMFVDRLFSSGMLLRGLNYELFQKLLFDAEWLQQAADTEEKLADTVNPFSAERQTLYRKPKVNLDGSRAEYFFEPQPQAEGDTNEILDQDEFITWMWSQGVKFGLLLDVIQAELNSNRANRVMVAQARPAGDSIDAYVVEVRDDLHRDNSPRFYADGRVDWRSRKNCFPHVKQEDILLQKINRQLGKVGYKVTGMPIEPAIPKDLNLASFSGRGTVVKQLPDGEFLVSLINGFLDYDPMKKQFSITEKMEHKSGVSARSTGNLELGVEEYIEHGEVQEGFLVKGKHLSFLSDVFGRIESENGNVALAQNLSGGSVLVTGGNLSIAKRASRAKIIVCDGEVTIDSCESTLIIANKIRLNHAINCELIANEIDARQIEGCRVAARVVHIEHCTERRNIETQITILVPDLSELDNTCKTLQQKHHDLAQKQQACLQLREKSCNGPEQLKFLRLYDQVQTGAVKPSPEQEKVWLQLCDKNATLIRKIALINTEVTEINKQLSQLDEELEQLKQSRAQAVAQPKCQLDNIGGQVSLQTLSTSNGLEQFMTLTPQAIRDLLQQVTPNKRRISSLDKGSLTWQFSQ